MQIERWQEIISRIKDKFEVEDSGHESIEDDGGTEIDYIIFSTPLGRIRLELVSKPVVLDKKTQYSRRIGSETKVNYVYGDEHASKMTAYKWSEADNEWEEIGAQQLGF